MTATIPAPITEVKERLNGTISRYQCERIAFTPSKAVILYRLPPGASFMSLDLPPHSLSFGYFWEDRPYNVYHWVRPDGGSAGWYCNIADRTRLTADTVAWRDLVLDVLVVPGRAAEVLDRDELPRDLAPCLQSYIENALDELLKVLPDLTAAIALESGRHVAFLGQEAPPTDILE